MKISLVQPNFQQGPKEVNAHYLPYSVGVLWSYVNQFETIKKNFTLDHIIWRRDNIDATATKLAQNDVIAFSTYVWNKNYNYALAKKIKELNFNCTIIFGGPEVPITNNKIFDLLPFIDIVVKSEGEFVFKDVLEAIVFKLDLKSIKGILINKKDGLIDTGDSKRIDKLDVIPSPYLTGVFDKIIQENPNISWNATLETNRGCPYQCTFCDWGSLTYNKIKKFNLDRVFAELEWMGKNKCSFVTITDANFGIFVDRDSLIADKLLYVQERYGYPESFSITWAKNQKSEVFDIVLKLIKSPKFNQGLTVSVQSMNLDVLENIKRKNLDQHKIENIFDLCDKYNVPVYTEIILGLPGETVQTWKEGIHKIIRAGNHTGINILQAQLLENAEMNVSQKEFYKITSVPVYDYMSGSYCADSIKESVEVVTSTKDISKDEMIECLLYNWFIQTFHINGLTVFVSRFLKKYQNLDYSVFYEMLYNFLLKDDWFIKERNEILHYYKNWMTTGMINHPKIHNIEIHGWNLIHRTTLLINATSRHRYLLDLVENFLIDVIQLDQQIVSELILFQNYYLVEYNKVKSYPCIQNFNYDFLGFIQSDKNLINKKVYKFDYLEKTDISLDNFLENIYFARKRNFGKAWVSEIKSYVN